MIGDQWVLAWKGPVLMVPGLHGSDDEHWQSVWERRFPGFVRVMQDDWARPDLDAWARRVVEVAMQQSAPVLVIAHSFGCLATVRAEQFQSQLIAGALLVAPADPIHFDLDHAVSQLPLLFPTTVISSADDPWISSPRAQLLAERWGGRFVDVGAGGHLNTLSKLGEWPQGLMELERLCRRMNRHAAVPMPWALARA